jgi:predicted secreted Zn-dependent protease
MIKGISIFILFTIVAATTIAGENNINTATIDRDSRNEKRNAVIPAVVTEKYEYYEVCGYCEKDLQCDLKQKCIKWNDGRKYDSVTNWKVKWHYGLNLAPEACTTDSFTVTVDITFQLPKWVHNGDAPQPLMDKWDTFMKNLLVHEQGHRDMAVEAATEFTRAVAELSPVPTCAELDREVNALGQERMKKLLKDQKNYDKTTNHGTTQGAVFP